MRNLTLACLAILALSPIACSSSSSGGGGNPDLPGVDSGGGNDSGGGGRDSMSSNDTQPGPDTQAPPADSSAPPTDAGGDAHPCGVPGDMGNSMGVGQYCQSSSDCTNANTPFCSDLGDPTTHFCTKLCSMPDSGVECGENATCGCQSAGACGCVPNSCL